MDDLEQVPPDHLGFGELIDWHVRAGTRPRGSSQQGRAWSKKDLADKIGRDPRTLRYWVNEKSFPESAEDLERVLFGNDQSYGSKSRRQLRDALQEARIKRNGQRRKDAERGELRQSSDSALDIRKIIDTCKPFLPYQPTLIDDRYLGSLITSASTMPPSPEILDFAVFAYRKLCEDLKRSALVAPRDLLETNEKAERDLRFVTTKKLPKWALDLIPPKNIVSSSWVGTFDDRQRAGLSDVQQAIGRPICVRVTSASVGSCAVLRWLSYLGSEIDVETQDASGRELVLRLENRTKQSPDFVISADAPMIMSVNEGNLPYARILDVHSEHQQLLTKNGYRIGGTANVFLYPSSSAYLQLQVQYSKLKEILGSPNKLDTNEIELADYPNLGRKMDPGDAMFAWRPLLDRLATDPSLSLHPETEFDNYMSLYVNRDWQTGKHEQFVTSFVNAFVAIWNQAALNPLAFWLGLVVHPDFLTDFRSSVAGISS